MLTVRTSDERFPAGLVDEWMQLLGDAEFPTPFHTPAWMHAWLRSFADNKKLLWLTAHDGNDLVGLFPLYHSTGAWRTLRPIGTGQSDYLHPLVRKGRRAEVIAAMTDRLQTIKDVDLIDLQQQRETFQFENKFGDTIEQATCLVLDLPTIYEAYLKSLSKSLRFDCRRLDKPPFKDGKVTIRQAEPAETERVLNEFFQLHARRWHKRGLPGSFATRQLKRFHLDAASSLANGGYLRLIVLEVDEKTVGVLYGMQVGKTRFFYQCGFEPEHKALSPGTLLVAKAIRDSIEEGCTQFDFLRGDEAYKRRWNPQHSFRNMRYILPLNSGLGSVGRAMSHAGSKIEEKIRARLEGRGLLR